MQAGAPWIPGDPHSSPVPAMSHPRLQHQGRALTAMPAAVQTNPRRWICWGFASAAGSSPHSAARPRARGWGLGATPGHWELGQDPAKPHRAAGAQGHGGSAPASSRPGRGLAPAQTPLGRRMQVWGTATESEVQQRGPSTSASLCSVSSESFSMLFGKQCQDFFFSLF